MEILKHHAIVTICGAFYKVEGSSRFYLENNSGSNSELFEKLSIDTNELQERVLGYSDYEGQFPFCKTLEDLTIFVNAIKAVEDEIHSSPTLLEIGNIVDIGDFKFFVTSFFHAETYEKYFTLNWSSEKNSLQKYLGLERRSDFLTYRTIEQLTLEVEKLKLMVAEKAPAKLELVHVGKDLMVCGVKHQVTHNMDVGFYITNLEDSSSNSRIFDTIHVKKEVLQESVLGYKDEIKNNTNFPYCKTLEDLEKFVEAINRIYILLGQPAATPKHNPLSPEPLNNYKLKTLDVSPYPIMDDIKINRMRILDL
jgi:hypothetical protein